MVHYWSTFEFKKSLLPKLYHFNLLNGNTTFTERVQEPFQPTHWTQDLHWTSARRQYVHVNVIKEVQFRQLQKKSCQVQNKCCFFFFRFRFGLPKKCYVSLQSLPNFFEILKISVPLNDQIHRGHSINWSFTFSMESGNWLIKIYRKK